MGLETGNYVYDLVAANPPAGDQRKEGDDHLRLIKKVIQQTFPHITGPTLPTSTGSANAQAVVHLFGPAAYQPGQIVAFVAGFTNTGPMTLAVNGLGAKNFYIGGAPVGAGNVIAGGLYLAMYDGVQFQMAGAFGLGGYLPLSGGTLTGAITLAPASSNPAITLNKAGAAAYSNVIFGQNLANNRWAFVLGNATAETGGAVGSDLVINRYSDVGTFVDTPLTISRATGQVTLTGNLLISTTALARLSLDAPAGNSRSFLASTAGSPRWTMALGNNTAESGGNAGSDFTISRYSDAGAAIDSPLTITRSTGALTVAATPLTIAPASGSAALYLSSAAGTLRVVSGQTAGVTRWRMNFGNATAEAGSNVGSDFVLDRFNDAGTLIDSPLTINRASGNTTIPGAIFTGGNLIMNATGAASIVMNRAAGALNNSITGQIGGLARFNMIFGNSTAESGSNAGSDFNFNSFNDAGVQIGSIFSVIRATRVVTFGVAIVNGPSDRSLKENIEPLEGALDKVQKLRGVSFNFIKDKGKRQIGLIAQDVAPIVPEVIQDFIQPDEEPKLAIDYTRLVPLLIEAIKELTARVAGLEEKLEAVHA